MKAKRKMGEAKMVVKQLAKSRKSTRPLIVDNSDVSPLQDPFHLYMRDRGRE